MSLSPLISCQSISKSFGPQTLFSDISIGFFENERLGLIGPNGSGKTTLLQILVGLEDPSSGSISRKRNLNLIYLSQEEQLDPELTVKEILFQGLPDALENWESNREIRALVKEMAFENLEQKAGTLSGGWRKRLAIAQALIHKPDLLFMDEPTNHLDLEGILWLEARLKQAGFAFVLVSHDRFFLENTTNRIVELSKRYPNGFIKVEGNYSRFLEKRKEILNEQQRHEASLSSKVRRELEWLARGPKARTTKARYRVDQAAQLQKDLSEVKGRNRQNQTAQLIFNPTDRKTKKLIETKSLGMTLGDKTLFKNLNLILSPGFCLGLLGRNGTGKSTLIHLLNGRLTPDSGSIKKADQVKVVTFGQKREQLDQDQLVKTALAPEGGDQVIYRGEAIHIVSWAKRFLFTTQQLGLPVSKLSGGEQARLLIANLMLKPADILLLDEPTNDLDLPTLEILEERLAEFPGAIVLITHDRYLLDRLSDILLSLEGNGQTTVYADIYQWQKAQQESPGPKMALKKYPQPQKKKPQTPPQKLSHEERKELNRIEIKIEKATEATEKIKAQLNDPAIQSDAERLLALSAELREGEEKVEGLFQRWEVLEALNE